MERERTFKDGQVSEDDLGEPETPSAAPPFFSREPADGSPAESGGEGEPALVPGMRPRVAAPALDEAQARAVSLFPQAPRTVVDVGLSKAFLEDLALKIIYYSGTPSTAQLVQRVGLGPTIVQQLVTVLAEERLCEILSQSDLYTGNYRYRLSERGRERVREALERNRYAGPAPVTTEQYAEVIRRQQANREPPSRGRIKDALNELVLSAAVSDSVARALYSGKSTLLYGPSGNGKSSIIHCFIRYVDGAALVPYAIYAYGQVIRVFDPSVHEPLEDLDRTNSIKDEGKLDRRWVLVKRPTVILGAEIGPESMNVSYDPLSHFYQAPPHIKAQGGILAVDDLGRQKMDLREIMARWLIPLERGWDTLTLITGEKLTVPFDMQLLFATNVPLRDFGDEALLRRILYKVEVESPLPEDFAEILRQLCRQKRVLVSEGAIENVVKSLYSRSGVRPRASHGRDILEVVIESANYDGRDPVLDEASTERAFRLVLTRHTDDNPTS